MKDDDVAEPEVYIDWNDEGPTLQCEREECMKLNVDGRRYWWWEPLPYKATPEQAAELRDAHVVTHMDTTGSR